MRFVAIKTVDQADLQAVHRSRTLLIKPRTAFINQIRGLLADYGLVMAQSPEKVRPALVRFLDDAESGLTAFAPRDLLRVVCTTGGVGAAHYEGESAAGSPVQHASGLSETRGGARDWAVNGYGAAGDRRSAPGVSQRPASGGLVGAGAAAIFQWGKERLGGISKRGSRYVRTLLIHGARAVVQRAERRTDTQGRWLCALTHRKGTHVAAVALANKNARVIWALLAHDEAHRSPA